MDHIAVCTALVALAKWPAEPRRQQLAERLTRMLADAHHQGRPLIECLDARGQASVLWAWAKMGNWPDTHFMDLLSTFTASARGTSGAKPQELSTVAWALNQAWQAWQDRPQPWHPSKQVVREYMQKLQAACMPVLQKMNLQDVSMLLSAAQGTGVLDGALAQGLMLHMRRLLHPTEAKFKPQALSISLWSLASLGHPGCQELLGDAARAVVKHGCMRGDDKPQAWSNLVWAFATLGHPDSLELCRYVSGQVVQHGCMHGATPQTWSNLMWAFATLGHPDCLELCRYVAGQVVQHGCMRGATPQAWSNLMWAFATLRYYEDGGAVFDLAIDACPALLRSMTPQSMSNLLYACAIVNHTRGVAPLLDNMLPYIRAKLGQFNEQGLANSCWSLAVLGQSRHPAMEALMREANSRQQKQPGCFTLGNLRQLWQAHLELRDQGWAHLGLSGQLREDAQGAWRDRGAEAAGQEHTRFQHQVAAAVRELEPSSVSVAMEGSTPCGMFGAVDILVTRPGQTRPLAVEVDGPTHFICSKPPRYDGSTELRNRQLGRLPLRGLSGLVLVSHHEWGHKSHQARLELLRVKLAQADVRGPGGAS